MYSPRAAGLEVKTASTPTSSNMTDLYHGAWQCWGGNRLQGARIVHGAEAWKHV